MKWLPRSKKSLLLMIPLILVAAGAGFFIIWSGNKNNSSLDSATQEGQVKEVKVADILLALKENQSHSEFDAFISITDLNAKLVPNEAGVIPKLMLFAPSNAAFAKDDVKPLINVPEPIKEELRLYHAAIFYPAADGTGPDLELSNGQKIRTLAGREIQVSKKGSRFILTDVKGRNATIDLTYMTDDKGNRLYFLNSVLLLQ